MVGSRLALGRRELDPCDPLGIRNHLWRNRSFDRLRRQRPLKDARSDPCRPENCKRSSPREHGSRSSNRIPPRGDANWPYYRGTVEPWAEDGPTFFRVRFRVNGFSKRRACAAPVEINST
jgi:hypothetical protein